MMNKNQIKVPILNPLTLSVAVALYPSCLLASQLNKPALPTNDYLKNEILFIDERVHDKALLLSNLKKNVLPIEISSVDDAFRKMVSIVKEHGTNNLDRVTLLSHASPGELDFGNAKVDYEYIVSNEKVKELTSLLDGKDLIILGCDIASGDIGHKYLQQLSSGSTLRIAASTNKTGYAKQGGDWNLEYNPNQIKNYIPFNDFIINNYKHTFVAPDFIEGTTIFSGKASRTLSQVVFGDVDGDGDDDAIFYGDQVLDKVYKNDGSGNFSSFSTISVTGERSFQYELRDIDGDNDLDALIRISGQPLGVYTNDGSGNFSYAQGLAGRAQSFAAEDFDNDGDIDIAVANYNTSNSSLNKIYIFENNGSGIFSNISDITDATCAGINGNYYYDIEALDADNDGDLDIISANEDCGNTYINNGSNTFSLQETFGTVFLTTVVKGDFDGDGDEDFYVPKAAFDGPQSNPTKYYSVLFTNNGTGTFTRSNIDASTVNGSRSTNEKLYGDFDNDGDIDYLKNDTFYLNNGSGSFTAGQQVNIEVIADDSYNNGAYRGTRGIGVGDVDGDGDIDAVFKGEDKYYTSPNYGYEYLIKSFVSATANNSPTVTGTPTSITITEDTQSNLDLSSIEFADADGDTLTVSLMLLNASFSAPEDGSGLGVVATLVSSTEVQLQGAASSINNYLDTASNIKLIGTANLYGNNAATLNISAEDTSATGLASNPNVSINITAVNDSPSGSVTISGTPTQGQTLTASNTLADEDGLGTINYQWLRDGVAISGETNSTYVLSQEDVGAQISVRASYTDGGSTAESVTSSATSAVTNTNDAPTGTVTINGTPSQGETLTASNTLADVDGLGTIAYQWLRDGVAISGATGTTLTLTQTDVGTQISVRASYIDNGGANENVVSAQTAVVSNVNDLPTGSVTISGVAQEDETLTASNTLADEDGLGTISYQWLRDGVAISGATNTTYVLSQEDVGAQISVRASYTDGGSTDESVTSSLTNSVVNINDAPTGDVTISGTPTQGQTLTASNTLADEDGLGTISYQWLRDGVAISGATNTTYVLSQEDVGAQISVRASYTDGGSTDESVTSSATSAVINTNDAPTGNVTINGTPSQGETLTASNTLADVDGLGSITYQWLRDGVAISGATGTTLTLTQTDVGTQISVRASYIDNGGANESVVSAQTAVVSNVNDLPTGSVTISGVAQEDETLTASNTLADEDGLGTISYQWLRGGVAISGATNSTYVLSQEDVGAQISVRASYTDGGSTDESVTSSPTNSVVNINDAPTGDVTISGTPTQGQTLTASNTLADEDGLGTINYQWLRDGVAISGATNTTYVLSQEDVGAQISVRASYTDGGSTDESVTSSATSAVTNTNDAPTGNVTINGTPSQGETLTASNTLADVDGLGTITYQWLRDGVPIDGATDDNYILNQDDVGAQISVRASYTDGGGTAESVTSSPTAVVTNTNDAPTGSVVISGTPSQGETLTASNDLADTDELGTITYQWLRDGVPIDGAVGDSYVLTQDDVDAQISVRASYTDGGGTAESVTSSPTAVVTNINDAPTGNVSINGTPSQGETLTASNTLADVDGLGTITYQWFRDGVPIDGAIDDNYILNQDDVGAQISVRASYTDGGGTAESVTSSPTAVVTNTNDAPTGSVSISGTPIQGEILTASNDLADTDELGTITYQWLRDGMPIDGAGGDSYVLTQDDVGAQISVRASYTDGGGTAESVTSSPTAVVTNINDAPTGNVTINGTPSQGETLTASNDLEDADGLGTITYQWLRDGVPIDGAVGDSYVLSQDDVGAQISVRASYTDGGGTAESVTSSPTAVVTNINDAPTGSVVISGTPSQGETLTASNDLEDADGLGTITYQWLRDGVPIDGVIGDSYVLTQDDVGAQISVRASYTDGGGTAESVTSSLTSVVTNINDAPTGNVTISGIPTQGETLTASNDLEDADGLGTITYQWLRDGVPIIGAIGDSYVLTQNDVGAQITVNASYTDEGGTAESVTSSPTALVNNTNDAPTGSVSISGKPIQGETLTASNNLADADGLGTIIYQWLRDGVPIDGAIGDSYVLSQDDVGAQISVRASYTDGGGTAEIVISNQTSTIISKNTPPTGSVSIVGSATLGATLTASNNLADEDGIGAISYQWLRDGVPIVGGVGLSYILIEADIGSKISVVATYIDGKGNEESVTSQSTAIVVETNIAPIALDSEISVDEDSSFSFKLDTFDVNGDDLELTIISQPQRGSLTPQGQLWLYTPDENVNGSDSFTFTVNDGEFDSESATVSIVIRPVNDAPVANNDQYSISSSAGESIVLDILNNDTDIDGDPITIYQVTTNIGSVSNINNLLTFTPPQGFIGDATIQYAIRDPDGEIANAIASLEIVSDGGDITITAPADISVNATGLFTKVDLGTATAVNARGENVAVTADTNGFFAPGKYKVLWSATEGDNIASAAQSVDVIPLVSLSKDQTISEGSEAQFKMILNGSAAVYPVNVSYTINGSVDSSDHSLVEDSITFREGEREKLVKFDVYEDGIIEGTEEITISLDSVENAVFGPKSTHKVTIVEGNVAPTLSVFATQNTLDNTRLISKESGLVTLSVVINDPNIFDSHSVAWLPSDENITDSDNEATTFTFEPNILSEGLYSFVVRVDDGIDTTSEIIKLLVVETPPQLSQNDSDDDGINDDEEGFGDDDGDGIPNYLDSRLITSNVAQEKRLTNGSFLMETEPGLSIVIGDVALRANAHASGVSDSDISQYGDDGKGVNKDSKFNHINGLFDFSILGLPVSGQSVNLVLAQFLPIAENSQYRKLVSGEWINFVENDKNLVSSATGSQGYCPPPGSSEYQPGLGLGHWCVQLTIEDGGPNDDDGMANKAIEDPGGVAVAISNNTAPEAQQDSVEIREIREVTVDVLANDTDSDGDTLTITSANVDIGRVDIVNNKLQYTAVIGFYGRVTILYGISDGQGGVSSSELLVDILPNSVPVAQNDTVNTDDRTAVIINVLNNDSDSDGDMLVVTSATSTYGETSINDDYSITYIPKQGYDGIDDVKYVVEDGYGGVTEGHVKVTITAYKKAEITNNSSGGGSVSVLFALLALLGLSVRSPKRNSKEDE
ncbi:Ig-like domain-containing protein [Pseudoalteromonas sp. SCSIO 43101]|uniref:Ig-like domain-containing protein n=1 Tax=Pseudoalteromonas sp. SCSIO 43101 TaxID=2822847 RepID=UPI00202B0829|nr:Ig-like domain-containing protein [Pseudoalteromonas sp. SCSIO 43101]URQ92795.1 tandem-95 repeat protein [Pseudoalteromonas sp. SCSIO 43101]